ncbi:MAG: hypothetical protein ACLFUH_11175 [Bacteroidales bacterium]
MIIFFTLYSWLGITQNTDKGQPFLTNYTPEEYNAHIQNWDIGKDSRGIVYAANVDGLLEYDGNVWNLHPLPEDATGRSLDFDGEGRVFFGTINHLDSLNLEKTGNLPIFPCQIHLK